MFKEGLLMAWQSLIANKMRTLLTMLGIIIGVAAVIALVSVGLGMRAQIQSNLSSLGSNLIMVYPGAPRTPGVRPVAGSQETLTLGDYASIAAMTSIEASSPVIRRSYVLVYKNTNWTTAISGVNEQFEKINNWTLAQGSFITQEQIKRRERVAVIGQTVVKNVFKDESPIGKDIRLNNQPFKVIGVLNGKGSGGMGQDQDDTVFVPYTTAMERLAGQNYLNMIYVLGKSDYDLNNIQADIDNLLRVRHKISSKDNVDFQISNMATIMETVSQTTGSITLFLGAIAAISLLVGGIGIMNIMLVSVTERTREIGVRKALGATFQTIMTQFLIEAVAISLLGGFIGVAFGIVSAYGVANAMGMPTVISGATILLAFGFSMMIGLGFGLYPARKAAKLNPIDALHYE